MSLFKKGPARLINYYHNKCGQHIRRTMASFDLSILALNGADPESFASDHPDLFDIDSPTQDKSTRMQSVLVKSHFLLLKVEMELFLYLLGLECWRVALLELRAGKVRLPKKVFEKLKSPTPQELLEHNDNIEALCATAVPKHGLPKIIESMHSVGTDLKKILSDHDNTVWSQVLTAFQVRHLIEHRNGYIDNQFRFSVKSEWAISSWGNRLPAIFDEELTTVNVTELDLHTTAKQMLKLLEIVEDQCNLLADRRSTAQGVPS